MEKILLKECLDLYQNTKKEYQNTRSNRALIWDKRNMRSFVLLIILALLCMYFSLKENGEGSIICLFLVIIMAGILEATSEIDRNIIEKIRQEKEWIKRLTNALKEKNITTVKQLTMIQEWCEECSKQRNWLEYLFSWIGKVIAAVIPIIVFGIQTIYSESKSMRIDIIVLTIISIVWYKALEEYVFPDMKKIFNKNYIVAENMKKDLQEVKFLMLQ